MTILTKRVGVESENYPIDELSSPVNNGDLTDRPGISQDDLDMQRLGKKQEFKRTFHSLSILGLTCVVMATWLGIIIASSFSLINGGTAGTIWVYIATWLFSITAIASLAEMASMAPSSGGQYHWVSEFAPASSQRVLSYISGWLSALGWQAFIAVGAFQSGSMILQLAAIKNPGYVPTPWQNTLMTIAVALFCVAFNIWGAKRIPAFEGIILFFHIFGFFAVMIPLWVLAPKAPAKDVFTKFENNGGWSSVGAACVIGQLSAAGAFIGADSAAHMAEEVRQASVTVPRMMMGTVFINGIMGLVAIITFVFSIQDVQTQIVESTAVYPFIDVFRVATGSQAGAIGMTIPIVVLSISLTINATAAASRQAWSFGRDDGLPFPTWICKVTNVGGTPIPLNAMLSSLSVAIVLSLINLGGSEAFNSIYGLVTGAVGMTYIVSIGCVLWRRLFGEPLPPARWSLGRWGLILNILGFSYEVYTTTISFFPLFAKVDAKSMNWGIAMFGGVAIICIVNYYTFGKKSYRGPVVHIVKDY